MANQKIDLVQLGALLPTHDNAALAEKFGVSRERIRQLRRIAGVDPLPADRARRSSKYSGVTQSAQFLKELGTLPDVDLSKKYGVPMNVVHAVRKSYGKGSHAARRREQVIPLLGKVPDKEISDKYGYSLSGVVALRRRYNVPAFATDELKPPRKRRTKAEMAAARVALGLPEGAKVPPPPRTKAPAKAKPPKIAAPTQAFVEPEAATKIQAVQVRKAQAAEVDEITIQFLRKRRAEGDSVEALAARLDMSEDTVRSLIQG